ncbi:serine-rich adhesin for platelets isoform X2 [Eurosta solidaginis]|uniref:serine-rich adhesin for platelets isoform X2 n=1 Tax=Eurosta solidaginis TaxID=178769 RepID=UPI003530DD26
MILLFVWKTKHTMMFQIFYNNGKATIVFCQRNINKNKPYTSDNNEPQTPLSTRPQQQTQHQQKFTIATPQPMFDLEIGGLVTTMHKSFLQDTSPPPSICSSMEVSMDRMNNSLITSADFSNINFLQSTQSLDFNEPVLNGGDIFNLANKATSDGYTLSDMIRDRKALESLTLSGDGTLIKDSHIGQIDDISLALSKTASGYSTMDNSTESMQDEQMQQRNATTTTMTNTTTVTGLAEIKCNIMHRTMLLSDDVISDTTFELVESSLCESSDNGIDVAAVTSLAKSGNETFKKPWPMDETVCLPTAKANATFECKQLTPDTRLETETRCETPENIHESRGDTHKLYESTPHAAGISNGAQQHTPTTSKLAGDDEANFSPIVCAVEQLNATRVLSDTFNQDLGVKKVNSQTFSGTLPRLESIEKMLDDIENPNETYEKCCAKTQELQLQQQNADALQMQNVLDLAYAEEELLASNNDQEFEDMLEEFSKVEVNAEHVKMKKSLETIKRRFNRDTITLTKAPPLQHDGEIDELHETPADMQLDDMLSVERSNGSYTRADINASTESKRTLLSDISAPSGLSTPTPTTAASLTASSAANSITTSTGGGERLLSRRSRLYDNINLSTISSNNHHSHTLGASFTVHKPEDNDPENSGAVNVSTEALTNYETECKNGEQDETSFRNTVEGKNGPLYSNTAATVTNNYSGICTYKLSERRERDRDRFKTIKIVKGRNTSSDGLVPVNVPCIDDDYITCVENGEATENAAGAAVFYNKSDIDTEIENSVAQVNHGQDSLNKPAASKTSKLNPNFLTYKKPKDKQTNIDNLPEIAAPPLTLAGNEKLENVKPIDAPPSRLRSRSRPRYISGLQKMTVIKATSAGDLDRASVGLRGPNSSISNAGMLDCPETNVTIGAVVVSTKFSRNVATQPIKKTGEEIKSPMGTKSKSFHNLSSNFGFYGNGNNGLPGTRTTSFGLKKPTVLESNSTQPVVNGGPTNASTQQADDTVFKVPKLMSGLRAPGVKRAGLVRPSSGFYSLNSLATKGMPPLPQAPLSNDTDSDGGRHSPSDSMSSASSRGSLHSGSSVGVGKPVATKSATTANTNTLHLTKITTGSTGIPKPSGLRPPTTTTLKRSGLPKPGTVMGRR